MSDLEWFLRHMRDVSKAVQAGAADLFPLDVIFDRTRLAHTARTDHMAVHRSTSNEHESVQVSSAPPTDSKDL